VGVPIIDPDDVRRAAATLSGVARRTPVLSSRTLDERVGATVLLKAENLQRAGAFKFRGAYAKLASLSGEERGRGVAAFSSGNHAQAVALAARILDSHAVILMPADAPASKVDATRGYDAEIVTYDRYGQDREVLGARLAEDRGLTLIRPYDDPAVMAGQGTVALELVEESGPLDVLIVPVGGGGLIAGSATAAKGTFPGVRVVGVEPETGDDTARSLREGRRVRIPVPQTIADGLQVDIPGELTFEVNRRLVDEMVAVTDDEILDAMGFLFDRMRVVVEPSGAVGVAALLAGKVRSPAPGNARVGVILSGGNVDVARFAALMGDRGWSAGE
jgi:threonine dehydratase